MKKSWLVGLLICSLVSFNFVGLAAPVSACIGGDGTTDDLKTNCLTVEEGDSEEEEEHIIKLMEISATTLDFGYLSEPGRSYTQTFVITNNTTEKFAVKLAVAEPEDEDISADSKLAKDWIAFVGGVRYFEVPAEGTKTVGVRVVVPADASFGSQYALITVENETLEVTEKIDVRLTVATEGVAFGGSVASVNVRPISIDDLLHADLTVKNEGNAGFLATYSVRVSPRFGLEEWRDVAEESHEVYPGAEVTFDAGSESASIGYGFMLIEQKITYVNANGEQVEEVSKRTILNLPLWAVIAIGGAVVLLILIAIIVKIAKKKKAKKSGNSDASGAGGKSSKGGKKKKAAAKAAETVETEIVEETETVVVEEAADDAAELADIEARVDSVTAEPKADSDSDSEAPAESPAAAEKKPNKVSIQITEE